MASNMARGNVCFKVSIRKASLIWEVFGCGAKIRNRCFACVLLEELQINSWNINEDESEKQGSIYLGVWC